MRALLLSLLSRVIARDDLLACVRVTGAYLLSGLEQLSRERYPTLLLSPRGVGTFLAFDLPSSAQRDALLMYLRSKCGVQAGGCGNSSVRIRPMLNFQPKHASILLAALDESFHALSIAHTSAAR